MSPQRVHQTHTRGHTRVAWRLLRSLTESNVWHARRTSGWQDHLRLVMERLGFAESKIMPGVYFNKSTGIEVATHVDDFLVFGNENVDFHKALLKEFELKCTLIGGGKQHQRSGLHLGRTITWTEDGYTWDQMRNMRKCQSEHLAWNSATPVPLRIAKNPRTCCRRMTTNCPNMRSAHTAETWRTSCISRRTGWICRSVLVSWLPALRIREGQTRHVLNVWADISKAAPCTVSCIAGNPKRLRSLCRRTAIGRRARTPDNRKVGALFSSGSSGFALVSAPNASGTFIR